MIHPGLLQDRAFVSTWDTEKAGSVTKTIVMPTSSTGSYACSVDWGDGQSDYITAYNAAAWTHLYAAAGNYTVKIYGKFIGFVVNNLGDKLKLINISTWGTDLRVGVTQGSYFSGCSNLTISATNALNTSLVTNMLGMFTNCALFNQSVASFNTEKVINMGSMFSGCTNFNQSVSNFNTAKVTNFASMFSNCTNFNQSVTNFNTVLINNMFGMFSGCTNFNQSVAHFNTANVLTISNMFLNAAAFNQDVSAFIIAKITTASAMFSGSGFEVTNYNKLLDSATGWPSQATILTNVSFSAGTAHYNGANAIAGKAVLVTTKTWTVTDGGTP